MRDRYWQSLLSGSAEYTPWLRDHGSLTRRIQLCCEHFEVRPSHNGLARIACDEAARLGFPFNTYAFSREVLLCADSTPVVFAHSTCARTHLRGVWKSMLGLGNRSLGTLLFSHPLVKRHPLHFKALQPHHSLYESATVALDDPPPRLWARRSLFTLHGAPLLVTEVFLPEILKLNDAVIPAKAGIQQVQISLVADKSTMLMRHAQIIQSTGFPPSRE
jgi:chorismate--pyruvate lyase